MLGVRGFCKASVISYGPNFFSSPLSPRRGLEKEKEKAEGIEKERQREKESEERKRRRKEVEREREKRKKASLSKKNETGFETRRRQLSRDNSAATSVFRILDLTFLLALSLSLILFLSLSLSISLSLSDSFSTLSLLLSSPSLSLSKLTAVFLSRAHSKARISADIRSIFTFCECVTHASSLSLSRFLLLLCSHSFSLNPDTSFIFLSL